MSKLTDVLGRYKPATASVTICLSSDHLPRWSELQAAIGTLGDVVAKAPEETALAAQLEELELERDLLAEEVDIETFEFQAISHEEFERLRSTYDLTTDEGRDDFSLGLVAAAMQPQPDLEELRQLRAVFSPAHWAELHVTAERLAALPARIDLGKADSTATDS